MQEAWAVSSFDMQLSYVFLKLNAHSLIHKDTHKDMKRAQSKGIHIVFLRAGFKTE